MIAQIELAEIREKYENAVYVLPIRNLPRMMMRYSYCAFGVVIALGLVATSVSARPEPLTGEQTMDLAFLVPTETTPWTLYERADPSALPLLQKVVENDKLQKYHAASWRMISFVGDEGDVRRIRAWVLSHKGVLSDLEEEGFAGALDALGILCGRQIKGAKPLCEELLQVDFWKAAPFKLPVAGKAGTPDQAYLLLSMAADGIALSGEMNLFNAVATTVNQLPEGPTKEYMSWRVSKARLAETGLRVKASSITEAAEPELLRAAKGRFNGNLSEPGPTKMDGPSTSSAPAGKMMEPPAPAATAADLASAAAIAREAVKAFEKIQSDMKSGDFEAVRGRLLNHGKPISEDKLTQLWTDYVDDFKTEQDIMQSPIIGHATPTSFSVHMQTLTTLKSLASDDPIGAGVKSEMVSVTYRLEGTAKIAERPMFRQLIGSATISDDGTLIVVLKRIDGKWYWQPFGW